jgi:hypothetical protein
MKKILLSISAVTAMIAMTATFSACSSDDEQSSTATLTINATRGDYGGGTRALSIETDGKIKTYWKTTDKVSVYKTGWEGSPLGVIKPITDSDNNITKLDGDVQSNDVNVGDRLELIMPRTDWAYTGQDGTLTTIVSNFDYNIASATINYFGQNRKIFASNAFFEPQQAIVKYKLVRENGSPLKVKTLTIISQEGKIVQSRDLKGENIKYGGLQVTAGNVTDEFTVAIRNDKTDGDKYTLTAQIEDGDEAGALYSSTSTNTQYYTWGYYITHTVTMSLYDNTYTQRTNYSSHLDVEW